MKNYKDGLRSSSGLIFYETTVGAGLPIINALPGLVHAGDEMPSIEGIFSGALSFIFNSLSD
ncbi:MAG: hypothetical protein J0L82_19695 [Deltaproteobacteria bacterium]|nr:hypothetical protein [Deltaproteobacteria bacterium]